MPSVLSFLQTLSPWWVGAGVTGLLILVAIALPKKILTPAGLAHAWVLGTITWGGLGWPGFVLIMFYLGAGSAVTFVGMDQKEAAGIAEERSGQRGPGNLWGSALTGTVCTLSALIWPQYLALLKLGFVASFATKLSDTCASEVGKAYGRRTYLITTFQPVPPGTEGAVSLEGTMAGMAGSVAVALFGWITGLIEPMGIVGCAIAAFVATNIESVLGATIEEKIPVYPHHVVNIINTAIGAIGAIILVLLKDPK
ncbi:TIGR00297 family protein [Lyngbya confervoides]|uniref:TIGR00297 family protein n=1 Tax=Lyngbya confervoides BDU141951 TaxID=1574623 RepID=A0ABD4T8Q5_9CYAN|nr:TIGR00297 family protein [Lyngbya confervoides]MCM1984914.1 TIGR00297 family protein [Lyngbya confervoides BDU141951]